MAHQTTLNGKRPQQTRLTRHLGALLGDMTMLAELQAKLWLADCRSASRSARRSALFMAAALVLALATLPVLLLCLALLIVELAKTSLLVATSVVTFAGLVGAAALFLAGRSQARSLQGAFDRSATELDRNYRWVKHNLSVQASAAYEDASESSARR